MNALLQLPKRAVLTIAAVSLGGLAALVVRLPALSSWSRADVLGMCALVAATAVGESLSLKVRFGSETKHVTMTESVFAAALLIGVQPSVLTVAVALGVAASNVVRGTASHKVLFNLGSWLLAITGAELMFAGLHGISPAVAIVAAMATFFVVNASTVLDVIAAATERRFVDVFSSIAGLEVSQAAGNLALGVAVAALWALAPAATAAAALVPAALLAGSLLRGRSAQPATAR